MAIRNNRIETVVLLNIYESVFARRAICPPPTSTTITTFATRNPLIVDGYRRVIFPETLLIQIDKLLLGIPTFSRPTPVTTHWSWMRDGSVVQYFHTLLTIPLNPQTWVRESYYALTIHWPKTATCRQTFRNSKVFFFC